MTKILVAEDERDIRELVVDTLFDKGYDILESRDGREAVDIAIKEAPDLILLDVTMPFPDGFAVVKKLKENILTESIPVVMLTAMGALDGEQNALDLGVKHYVSKPFDLGLLLATMRVALREAGAKVGNGDDFGKVWGGSTLFRSVSDSSGPPTIIPIASQLSALEKKLDGGFRLGNLRMIEGPSATGKSLLAQDVTSGALDKGLSVAYFASQHTPRSLEAQVKSIGMDWSEHLKSEKLVVYPLQAPVTGQDSGVARGDVHGYGAGPEQASNHYLGCHHKSGQFQPRAGNHRFLHHLQAAHKHGPDHLLGFTFDGLQRRPVSPCFIDV